ncbi:MAG: uracil-DNA glycosylase [Marinilabiliales bacterium]|nr:MAG: uracil-DNA glycosylase [Marinilabiliales bacterium]
MFSKATDWQRILSETINSTEFRHLIAESEASRKHSTVFPEENQVFRAFEMTSFENLKVVILGQDPYHGPGQANGLAFSVNREIKLPPSLKNIYKELQSDAGVNSVNHGDLSSWASRGVLLLNSVLTVEASKAGSHRKMGWQNFTDEVIKTISQKKEGVVFLLWGNYAIEKSKLIDTQKHHILTATHPSPLSAYRGFFGCRHFSKANLLLKNAGIKPVDWQLPE